MRAHACVEGFLHLLLPPLHRHVMFTPNKNKDNSCLQHWESNLFIYYRNYKSDFWQDNTMKAMIRVHAVHEPPCQVILKGFNYKGVFT